MTTFRVGVAVGVRVGVLVGVAVIVGVGVMVAVGVTVGVLVGVGVGWLNTAGKYKKFSAWATATVKALSTMNTKTSHLKYFDMFLFSFQDIFGTCESPKPAQIYYSIMEKRGANKGQMYEIVSYDGVRVQDILEDASKSWKTGRLEECVNNIVVLGQDLQGKTQEYNLEGEKQIMNETELLKRITSNPNIMTGKPVIKGTRLTVEFILNLLAHGTCVEEILDEYEGLTKEDIQACLLFATRSLQNIEFMPLAFESN